MSGDGGRPGPKRLRRLIAAALTEAPADLLIRDARVFDVFTGTTTRTNVAVVGGLVAGTGDFYREGREVVELSGRHLLPGFIDSHIHVESTMLTPEGFAEVAALHGTTTAISDPHEITNVKGLAGYRYMVEASTGLPVDILYTVPSCVPASRMETSGAYLGPAETAEAFSLNPASPALSEMMSYASVLAGEEETLARISVAAALGRPVDGHAPLLSGMELCAYASAGISSDHETTTAGEALEKISRGMQVLVREGSTEKNLAAILPAINPLNSRWFCFATDDRHPADLIGDGEIDAVLKKAVSLGLDRAVAIQMATINAARHYRLYDRGAVAPGYRADMVAVEDLDRFRVTDVFKEGRPVVRDGALLSRVARRDTTAVRKSVVVPADLEERAALPDIPAGRRVRVIKVLPDQVITRKFFADARDIGPANDIIKAVVIERHKGTGNVGVGLVSGFGINRGALASTVSHDSHNLVAVGADDRDIVLAARRLVELEGGMVAVAGGRVLAELALPVGGLMSELAPEEVAKGHAGLREAALMLGCTLPSPFMTMSFIALPVIPELKLTDMGLVDVERFSMVKLWE